MLSFSIIPENFMKIYPAIFEKTCGQKIREKNNKKHNNHYMYKVFRWKHKT